MGRCIHRPHSTCYTDDSRGPVLRERTHPAFIESQEARSKEQKRQNFEAVRCTPLPSDQTRNRYRARRTTEAGSCPSNPGSSLGTHKLVAAMQKYALTIALGLENWVTGEAQNNHTEWQHLVSCERHPMYFTYRAAAPLLCQQQKVIPIQTLFGELQNRARPEREK